MESSIKPEERIGCDPMLFVRENVKRMKPYSSARSEFAGTATVFLDANESPFDQGLNRYPDPNQLELKQRISKLKAVPVQQIFLGNGSDEVIDLLFRAFCQPGRDNVVICTPTYGMYKVAAELNDIRICEVNLGEGFQPDTGEILTVSDQHTRLLFLCSPNNPTGDLINHKVLEELLEKFRGIVILDEAYVDFAPGASFLNRLEKYRNLFILQTFSKAWGLAGLRLGMGFASEEIIKVLNKIKPPYNVNVLSQQKALEILNEEELTNERIQFLINERERVCSELKKLKMVKQIFPSEANFLLLKVNAANELYQYLMERGIVIRNRSSLPGLEDCVRISIGTRDENDKLLNAFSTFDQKE